LFSTAITPLGESDALAPGLPTLQVLSSDSPEPQHDRRLVRLLARMALRVLAAEDGDAVAPPAAGSAAEVAP
jgi:hypothetical protein